MYQVSSGVMRVRMTVLCLLLALGGVAQASSSPAASVGQVTLSIGQAVLVRIDGERVSAVRGMAVRAGDRIDTTAGGHVHVRFIDGAMVSVRPDSRLIVEDYRYTPAAVADSTVKFRLERGTARAISGAAAEGAKERFRLNTPLVAIGVRGTDFVVSSRPTQTLATVNQGAIVIAPFSETCMPGTLGPCSSPFAQLLSADMGGVMAEFRDGLSRPEIRSVQGLVAHGASGDLVAGKAPSGTGGSGKQGGGTVVASGPTASGAGESSKGVENTASMNVGVASVMGVDENPVSAALTQDLLTQVISSSGTPSALAWGRWGGQVSGTDFAQPVSVAKDGRQVTVGNAWHVLYRAPDDSTGTSFAQAGKFDFSLKQGHAQLNTASGVQPASVTGGQLSIDFTRRQFATLLNLQSAVTGLETITASGQIKSNGMFAVTGSGGKVAGAAAFDTQSVGYLFEKAVASGVLSGITLWAR
jgi:hypothetical protein